MSERLIIPTLVPEWAKPPTSNVSESSTPLRRSQSRESSSQLRPTYHGIIESNLDSIVIQIKPLASLIENESRRKINEFNLGSSIGYGQFGKVYKARLQNHIYAIKSIAKKPWNAQQYSMNQTMRQIKLWRQRGGGHNLTGDEAVMMMNVQKCRWEIYILSKLHSPYVVQLHKFLDSPVSKAIWIVNEWCSLGELEWKRNSVDEIPSQWSQLVENCDDVLKFVEKALHDLTQGLTYLKSQGCIHRDIKPSNILVDGKQKLLKLSDFGCSILTPPVLPFQDDSLDECFQAELNKIVGTPAFIAPELCQFGNPGTDDVRDGFKLDVWSAGVTLYGLLYNELPFYGESEFDTYHKAIHKSLENRLNGNRVNDLIIGRMLEKDPEIRIDTEKLQELVMMDHKLFLVPVKQGKFTTAATARKSPTEKHQTSMQKFFAKFFKLKKKDKTKKNSVATSANPSADSPAVSSGTFTSEAGVLPNSGSLSKPSPSPKPSPLPQEDDFSEPSLQSSLSSFEEPVQVSDLFKQNSAPLHSQEGPPPSDSGIIEGTVSAFESEPRRVDEYGLPHSTNESSRALAQEPSHLHGRNTSSVDANADANYEDEPRRLDHYGFPQPHDYPTHSRQFSTEHSEEYFSHASFELKTPPKPTHMTHSRQPSNLDRHTGRDIDLPNYSQPSFQASMKEETRDDYYDTSVTSKQPSFQLSVPPEIIQERSPQPVVSTSQPSSGSKNQYQHYHQPNASMSTSSSSPIKIPTPMKALIHMGNSPVKEGTAQHDSPLKGQGQSQPHKANGLAHSKDISNFQNYIFQQGTSDATPQEKHKSILTEDLIEKYLNYADNS
ncbi:hypothetical protein ZYGR_0AS00410 [Zygosaccharomyces rouxii]|uniref:Protein kinase domain-containing protein n=1 Tax=Zygosaccharomyces rouxii TaxID=4956 RepID=A0A1Q3AG29_ZYGRO|nr:hypothetical protein ZYGR_0AS00410 [Zygosaccharomyces rouxii]